MAKATLPNADARKDLFWKMEGRWVTSSKVFSFLRDLMTEYIHDSNTTKLKPKPKIKPIIISEDKLQFLNRKLEDTKVLEYQKRDLITKIAGGLCAICQEAPTKGASYDMHGITLIERYCDKCIEKISLD
jgi:hypothetical protein